MSRFYMAVIFGVACLAGFGLIIYAIMAISRANLKAEAEGGADLEFSESTEHAEGLLDLDTGHEGLKHRGKEPFDPEKHRPEPL